MSSTRINIEASAQLRGIHSRRTIRTLATIVVDSLLVLCLSFLNFFVVNVHMPLHQRGYVCGDTTLMLPYRQPLMSGTLIFCCLLVETAVIVTLLETLSRHRHPRSLSKFFLGHRNIPQWLVEIYKYFGMHLFGTVVCYYIVTLGKRSIGRLRPHFFAFCNPRPNDGTNCSLPENLSKYVNTYTCQTKFPVGAHIDYRKSFPSGEVSYATFACIYLVLYLQTRWLPLYSHLIKPIIQWGFVSLALYLAASKVRDGSHHWEDVTASLILGSILGFSCFMMVDNLFRPHGRFDRQL